MRVRTHILALLLGGLLVLGGCALASDPPVETTQPPATGPATSGTVGESRPWLQTELRDAVTGETFRIADFRGRPVFVESFAVWCPTCRRQLLEVKEVLSASDAVLVAIDTDPNEDEQAVRDHVERHGFAGMFAVAPRTMTEQLLDEFGPEIVAVPTAPVILVSADQTGARLLDRGVKSAEELLSELEQARGGADAG